MLNQHYTDPARCAEAIVDRVGRDIRMAVPIGIGKPMLLLDALYVLAEADRSLKLTIFTGLTLTRPGEYEYSDLLVMGIRTFHDGEGGGSRGENMVFSFEIEP